jgi:hypothetical protein
MKHAVALAVLLFLAAAPAFAERSVGFRCRPDGEWFLCESFGLSELKRAPEWEIQADGERLAQARGWRVLLKPVRVARRYLFVLRVFIREGRELMIVRQWERPE